MYYPIIVDKSYSYETYGYKDARDASSAMIWTEIANECPVTVNWLKNVFPSKRYGRVRFMLLEAGGSIGLHSDTDTESIVEAVNISLSNHPDCKWFWEDGSTIDFTPGNAYALNLKYFHRVSNNSNEDRYHIIIHHHDSTPEWIELMEKSLKENNAQGNFVYSEELY
jgi:hypothetical protein